jgi:RNA polymerase sigma factor (sigma-70 family)
MSESNPDSATGDRWLQWYREAQAGNQQAEAQLLHEVRAFFRAIAMKESWKETGATPDASDIAQDCCLKLTDLLDQFHGSTGGEFLGWLRTMPHSAILNAVRERETLKRGGGRLIGGLPADSNGAVLIAAATSTPSKELMRQEQYRLFEEAMEQLSDDHQRVIRLRLLSPDRLTWAEIARQMDRGEDAVKHLFQRAYQQLKRLSEQLRD